MRPLALVPALLVAASAAAAPVAHTVFFGKTQVVKWATGPTEDKVVDLKIRPMYVDGHVKEFTTGEAHDVTDRLMVVRRVFRVNDLLPQESKSQARWVWRRDGWLKVDRATGRVSQIGLPYFDVFYSVASWYRDYAAYCGLDADGRKLYAVVAQLGSRKPTLRKELGTARRTAEPDSECAPPAWQRQPTRVTFEPRGGQKVTFEITGEASVTGEGADAKESSKE